MRHGGIARTYYRSYVLKTDLVFLSQRYDQAVNIINCIVLHLIESVILFCVNDSAYIILAEIYLAVVSYFCIEGFAGVDI